MGSNYEQPSKRRRLDDPHQYQPRTFTDSYQIQEALKYRSSISPDLRASINHFKDFLSGIDKTGSLAAKARDLQILSHYCELQTAPTKEEIDFPDLLSAWSAAVENGNDALCSAIPAVIAQFFKTISGLLEFRSFGLSLCHSLLKRDQVRLLDRGLSSSKSKEHLISPCLRLLTEISSFDGGTLANHVFARRDSLFKRLHSLLEPPQAGPDENRRRPTVRRMALRLMMATLKYLDAPGKSDFLLQHRTFRVLFRGLAVDGDDIVVDMIKTIETSIFDDSELSRSSKIKFFSAENLSLLATIYDYEPDSMHADADTNVREALHKLLSKVCASRKGVTIAQTGWYPLGYNLHFHTEMTEDCIDLGLDAPSYFDDFHKVVPVRNTNMSTFLQSLKPESDTLQSELILKTMEQAPELVADYVAKKSKFITVSSSDSKFRGQFAFLFSLVQLPLPHNLGWQGGQPPLPPPISIVIESILPKSFSRATLTRFFTSNDSLLILSGSRLLSETLSKLAKVLDFMDGVEENRYVWKQAYRRLIEAVLERVPQYKDIIETLQRCGKDDEMLRKGLFECIAMFSKVLPEATSETKFDFGPILLDALKRFSSTEASSRDTAVILEQVQWLITIAWLAPSTKWWSKSGSDSLSLFTTVLQHTVGSGGLDNSKEILAILESVMNSTGIVNGSSASFAALLSSLDKAKGFEPSDELYLFLDNSMHRAIQKPVKFVDRIESEQQLVSDKTNLSLLACSVADQWEFALTKWKGQKSTIKNVSRWIARYYSVLDTVGENFRVLSQLQTGMLAAAADGKPKEYLTSSFEKVRKRPIDNSSLKMPSENQAQPNHDNGHTTNQATVDQVRPINLKVILGEPVPAPLSLENIDRWDAKTDIESAIQSGRISKLIRSTSSPESEIRIQAFQHLQNLSHLVDESSSYPEKAQLHLLLSEINETIRQHDGGPNNSSFPSIAAELGAKLVGIIADPSHKLFGKTNKFLLRAPTWDLNKLISYWTDKILYHEPEVDEQGSWSYEIEWLLTWLTDSLKTKEDMEIYRRSGIFEKILALYANPAVSVLPSSSLSISRQGGAASNSRSSIRKLILTVLFRAICVGGADTLITRVGLHAWLAGCVDVIDPDHAGIIRELSKALDDACDSERIKAWKLTCPLSKKVSSDQ